MRQVGLGWGLLAALGYAAMNLSLRAAAVEVDPFVAALLRSVPLCLLSWAMVARGRAAGARPWPGRAALARLALVGLLFNISGNACFQLALALGGLTLTVPVSQGAVLWGGALVGWWLMRERLARRQAAGLTALVAALPLLTLGVGRGAGAASGGLVWLAALAAASAGLSYGGGNALLRQTVLASRLGQGPALAAVTSAGFLSLLAIVLIGGKLPLLMSLDARLLGWLALGGVCNAVALGSLSRALSLLPVTRVNALSTLQTALSAVGGVALFAEPLTGLLLLGLALSLGGTLLVQSRRPAPVPASSAGEARIDDRAVTR